MTVINFIDLIRHKLSGGAMTGDLESKYHKEIIRKYISAAFNEIMYATFRKSQTDLDIYTRTFKNVTIQYDAALGLKYSMLPSSVIQLPGGGGVRRISPMMQSSMTFKPVSDNALALLQRTDVGVVGTETWYSYNNKRIDYFNISDDMTQVLIKMIVPFDSLGDSDEFPTPAGMDTQIFEIVSKLMGNTPIDLDNDNNTKRV